MSSQHSSERALPRLDGAVVLPLLPRWQLLPLLRAAFDMFGVAAEEEEASTTPSSGPRRRSGK